LPLHVQVNGSWGNARLDVTPAAAVAERNQPKAVRRGAAEAALFDDPEQLRGALLDFIADFADWDNSSVSEYIDTSRQLTDAAHKALGGAPDTRPLVVDPFAGGGSIPLEALRVGADAFASDLNPVAVLLTKVVLEYVPKYGLRLADEIRKWGAWIQHEAKTELVKFYPKDADGATPIAYLWARTIQCEGPGCGSEVPLIRSVWLANKTNRSVALQLLPKPNAKRVEFQIIVRQRDGWVDQGNPKIKVDHPRFESTVRRGSATCPCCGYATPVARVREQLSARRGGSHDTRLLCVVIQRPGEQGVAYRLPTSSDLSYIRSAERRLEARERSKSGMLSLIPDEPTPEGGGSGAGRAFSQRNYGMDVFGDLFNYRQLLTLTTFVRLIQQVGDQLRNNKEGEDFAKAVCLLLSCALAKLTGYLSTLCVWRTTRSCVAHTFGRQGIPIVWDFGEMNPFVGSAGDWDEACRYLCMLIEKNTLVGLSPASVELANALSLPLPDDCAFGLITDPPYYDAVPYADLSDYFYVWHKRTLQSFRWDLLAESLAPKADECIVDEVKGKDRNYFERSMQQAMTEGRRILAPQGISVVVFAHKSTSGWEALLQAMIDAGWIITASWPIDTERPGRLRANDSAALASSVHLVCRPRQDVDRSLRTAEIGDWRDVLRELPRRIHNWMPRLAEEGVVGADAIFACLGPALEVFSRHSRVEKPNGDAVGLKQYLEHVWAAISKEALSMIFEGASTEGFEPDSRLTAMWLWTLAAAANKAGTDEESSEDSDDEGSSKASKGKLGFSLEYDAARKIAQGLGANLEILDHVIEVKGDTARLISVAERTAYLFGKEQMAAGPVRKKRGKDNQLDLFKELAGEEPKGTSLESAISKVGETTLDRVHQSMLLFAANRGEALRRFLIEDGAGQDQRFWRLAQALSALYPKNCDEKRWVDGVLARKKGLGL
jgi:putative DNA methylase